MHPPDALHAPVAAGLPCGWLRLDTGGRILQANPGLAAMAGRSGPLEGVAFDELLTLASRVVYQSYLLPLLRLNGTTAELNLSLRQPEGRPPLDVLLYSGPVAEAPGEVEVLLVPIHQRRRIEDELARVKRAADHSPLLLFQLEAAAEGRLRFGYASQSVRGLFGCSPEAAVADAEAVFGRYGPAQSAALRAALDNAARTGQPCRVPCRLQPPAGGDPRHHEWHVSPRMLPDGRWQWHGHVADVTERLALEHEAACRLAAEQSARLRKEFLARASHELRTPLNAILGFAQLLSMDGQDELRPAQRQALDVLQSAGRHMLALVNQLLDLSRVESAAMPLAPVPGPVHPLLSDLAGAWAPLAARQGLGLVVHIDPALTPQAAVGADPVALRQALDNLLSNAIKYTPPGGRVELFAQPMPEHRLALGVSDSGPGLDAEQQAHLFEPFNRLGAERGRIEGTGLGLVVCRQLALALGGTLELESAPGQGSRFWLDLPRAADDAPATLQRPADAAARAQGLVLYVEDNEVNALLMRALAARRPGLDLQVAASGREAMALLDSLERPPRLLLLDRHLPDTDGEQLLARLRSRPALARVPAVLVTAADGAATPPPPGFADRWLKPLDVAWTLAELDRLLGD